MCLLSSCTERLAKRSAAACKTASDSEVLYVYHMPLQCNSFLEGALQGDEELRSVAVATSKRTSVVNRLWHSVVNQKSAALEMPHGAMPGAVGSLRPALPWLLAFVGHADDACLAGHR